MASKRDIYGHTNAEHLPNAADRGNGGEWKTGWGAGPSEEGMVDPADIKGHWAEKDLNTLLQYQIILPDADGNIRPDQPITRGEWLNMMVKAADPHYQQYHGDRELDFTDVTKESPYYAAVLRAIDRNWVHTKETSLRLDQPMTRQDLAVSLTRIVKYDKLAKFMSNDQTVSSYADTGQIQEKGAVAVVERLGLMRGSGGNFLPQGKVTKAEAATVLMRLVYLQGKTDQSILR